MVTEQIRELFIDIDMTVFALRTSTHPLGTPPKPPPPPPRTCPLNEVLERAKKFTFLHRLKDELHRHQTELQ